MSLELSDEASAVSLPHPGGMVMLAVTMRRHRG